MILAPGVLPTTFGRALTRLFHMSPSRIDLRSQRRKSLARSDDCATKFMLDTCMGVPGGGEAEGAAGGEAEGAYYKNKWDKFCQFCGKSLCQFCGKYAI